MSITVKTGYFTQVSASFIGVCVSQLLAAIISAPECSLRFVPARSHRRANLRKWLRRRGRPALGLRLLRNVCPAGLRFAPRDGSGARRHDCHLEEKLCRRHSGSSRPLPEEKWSSLLSRWEWKLARRNRALGGRQRWRVGLLLRTCANPARRRD